VGLSFHWDGFDIEGLSWELYNILKGLSTPLTVYLDIKHCGLE